MNKPVTSREFKLMLNVSRFEDRDEGSQAFWNLVKFLADKSGGTIINEPDASLDGRLKQEEKRKTYYLDTKGMNLRQHSFSLRIREEAAGDKRFQINLKCRASDRYFAATRNLSTTLSGAKGKFEEDIMPPFSSKFSISSTIKTDSLPELSRISDLQVIFPGLESLNLPVNLPLEIVSDFTAHEVVRKIGIFQFGDPSEVKASLSFWYLLENETDWPLVAEFSFDYDRLKPANEDKNQGEKKQEQAKKETEKDKKEDNRLEEYPVSVVQGTSKFFASLQNQSGWVNLTATTKTAFALDSL